jgi:hypothetical protein
VEVGSTVGKPEDLDLFGLSQPTTVTNSATTNKAVKPTFAQHRHRLPFLPFMTSSFSPCAPLWQETSQTLPHTGKERRAMIHD